MALVSSPPDREIDPVRRRIDDPRAARFQAALFVAGATLGVLSLALSHDSTANEIGILIVCGVACAAAAFSFWRSARLGLRSLEALTALGTVLITFGIHFSGSGEPSPLVLLYIWPTLAFYFFPWQRAALQLVLVALGYALVVGPDYVLWWTVTLVTLVTTGAVIYSIRGYLGSLIAVLEDAAQTDALTSLLNRRGFRDRFELELERARRAGGQLSLLVGDLDHFKQVNDRYGHEAGDRALKRVAAALSLDRRRIDAVARIGGEEFALLLSGTGAPEAFAMAERLRRSVREAVEPGLEAVSISFGIATFPTQGDDVDALMRAGDEALYTAKRLGRDRAVTHSPARAAVFGDDEPAGLDAERYLSTLLELVEAADLRLIGSAHHSEWVGSVAQEVAAELGLDDADVERVRLAGLLHDVGKACLPDWLFERQGALTGEARREIRRHPQLGASLLEPKELADVREMVLAHHERPDGLGYPFRLSAEEIPLGARIISVADGFEAMTNERSYRGPMTCEAACAELREGAGTRFDADVVAAFLWVLERRGARR